MGVGSSPERHDGGRVRADEDPIDSLQNARSKVVAGVPVCCHACLSLIASWACDILTLSLSKEKDAEEAV